MKNYTDFAAFKIKKTLSNSCDITFRRNDKKETKAILHRDSIDPDCVVHKNGMASSITCGTDEEERKLKEITEDERNGNDYNDDDVEEEKEGGDSNSDDANGI